ncbi:MAG: protein kinase [Acidobacteriota bacterium]|nr:protein kinase [Acidobacteriota bacterium]
MDATVKKKIGKYEITGILGRGGMGVVYRAEDKRIGRLVAIKTLTEGFSGQPEMLERFYREAQAGILQHPNIVIVYDLGDEDGVPFIVMEYVEGDPLDKLISSGRQINLVDKLSIIEQVCSALGYAHQRGVVHRDIKPANVIVQSDGTAKLVDFGIARVQNSGSESGLTRTGNVIGTVHYIAPERLRGRPFDGRSDIFSTGVMLYLLLAGQLPFDGEDMTVLQKLVNEPHPPLRSYLSAYPPALDGILDRALAKEPEHRYATAEEFAADLHSLGEELKKGQVSELFSDAERLTSEQQFGRAREILLQLVRIDPQHTGARQLLGTVQQNLARMQRAEQVRQLVAEAEEALASSRFPEALSSLDQAVKLDPENEELKARLEAVREKKQRYDEIGGLMTQADALRERGDWTGALNVVEKALRLDSNNTGIRAAYVEISRQAKIAAQQGQIRELLGKARQELTSRRFTTAIEILREVGKIDPSLPEMENLLQTAVTGQEQERRRKLIEQIQAEIENCLAAEDYDRATELVERAVVQLPSESSLVQLKTRVALQTRQFRVKQLIDATAAKAQETFQHSPGEALLIVQKALQELPGEERLLALEDSLRQRLKAAEKEEVRGRYLREAQQAIDRSEFDKAVEILESYQLEFADAAGVGELLNFARNELAQQQHRTRIAACIAQARALMQQEQFGQAIRLIEPVSAETGDPSLARLMAEARAQQEEYERKAGALLTRISKLRERGQIEEAIQLVQTQPAASAAGTPMQALLADLRAERVRRQATNNALAAASQAAEQGRFNEALESLQGVQRAYGESPELAQAVAAIESRRAQLADQTVSKAVEAARAALLANDTETALRELRSSAEMFEFASPAQQADWRRLNAEAAKPAARRGTGNVPQVGMDAGALSDEPAPRKSLVPILAGGALLLALAAGGFWWFHAQSARSAPPQTATQTAPPQAAPIPVPPTGTLLVKGNVDGVGIFVDGLIKGFTQSDGSLKVPLDPGSHAIRLTKAGYSDFTPPAVTIAANSQATLNYSLARTASAAAPVDTTAFLSIQSTPGAQVSIDHTPQGNTDARGNLIVQVKPGTRSLSISLNGYQPFSQNFSIRAGEKNNMAVMLTPVPAAPRPAATPQPQPVQILSFSATAAQIEQGQPTTLQWQTANASEVSIDNGIARVDNSGQTTVRPLATTTYMLTAKGSSGTQQRSVNIVVEPRVEKAAAPAPAPAAKVPPAVDERALVEGTLNSFKAAWNAHDMARMRAAWAGMSPQQAKGLQSFFKDNPKASVADDCPSSALHIAGDTADWACTETTTIISGGRPLSSAHSIHFTFARKGGTWIIADRR